MIYTKAEFFNNSSEKQLKTENCLIFLSTLVLKKITK